MNTYRIGDWHVNAWQASEQLLIEIEREQDCVSALCTLSGVGMWETAEDESRLYHAAVSREERTRVTETGIYPVETYKMGDTTIPTKVARHFGLGEIIICGNAGDFLQGDQIIDRQVYRLHEGQSDGLVAAATTLREILKADGEDDVHWKSVEWRHIQLVVDTDGGQTERFQLVSAILRRLAEAQMDADTFIPYGDSFADSDFIDSF